MDRVYGARQAPRERRNPHASARGGALEHARLRVRPAHAQQHRHVGIVRQRRDEERSVLAAATQVQASVGPARRPDRLALGLPALLGGEAQGLRAATAVVEGLANQHVRQCGRTRFGVCDSVDFNQQITKTTLHDVHDSRPP